MRVKLTLEGPEEDDDDRVSPTVLHKMSNTLEISLISDNEFKCRHSQPECGYGLQPDRWTEYSIQTMEPDNLELIFDFFEEDLSEHVVQGDALPGHVGTACLLSSTIAESGKSAGILTLPIMSRNSRKTIGKVRVCDNMFLLYFRLAKVQENTIASLRNAASHGAAFVEFDVHLSKDFVPVVYHDLTCCLTMKKKYDADPVELFEIPVKELTFDQLQLLKLAHVTALKSKDRQESVVEEENSFSENQPFPSLKMVLESLPEDVGFNIEIKWICQQRGINAHTEDLLRNPSYIQEAKAKGLVIFCWGDDTNDPENRRKLKEFGVNGLIYDRIYDWMPEQPNIFQVEQLERLKQELPELKSCLCPTVSRFVPSSLCGDSDIHVDANGIDNVENA
ncbi:Glycerophosphocholine phosphodiesterase GPCPD1 [Sciurus carolinensis]|uniref:Glycerophosphocholine phosphodiesterase GPCPD1 n=1 Tax=Sciurus carolinensis TaxID=30640 RepID=A0AA41SX64_SCICA|nr:Glycerophosphocholine phosphodiesterase GPCPD1 [Sciurus carolinensis]